MNPEIHQLLQLLADSANLTQQATNRLLLRARHRLQAGYSPALTVAIARREVPAIH